MLSEKAYLKKGAKNIFTTCKKYEEALREAIELWDIKIPGAYSLGEIQNPVRDNYAVIGLTECGEGEGLLSQTLCRRISRKIRIRSYTSENKGGNEAIEVLSRICKKLKALFPDEIGNMKLLSCEYITEPYAYCAEGELELFGCYGDKDALGEIFEEEI